ncbi:hypothetical protein DPEC_G00353480 [Dallia pectoralis]|uniref:Uncharacterized protein n=1 Tax=Dallia pectoralis TaxID=75939 RepID=A0ACC2F2H5_DALPE|nr:hypothetical protein DPEC_G00353480 [Dallia pectoralis]
MHMFHCVTILQPCGRGVASPGDISGESVSRRQTRFFVRVWASHTARGEYVRAYLGALLHRVCNARLATPLLHNNSPPMHAQQHGDLPQPTGEWSGRTVETCVCRLTAAASSDNPIPQTME